MKALFVFIFFVLLAGSAAGAVQDLRWRGPGCYIVYSPRSGSSEVIDGIYTDDASCRMRLKDMRSTVFHCAQLDSAPARGKPDPRRGERPCLGAPVCPLGRCAPVEHKSSGPEQ